MSREIIHLVLRTREVAEQVADIADVRATVDSGEKHIEMFRSQLALLRKRIPDDIDTDRFLKELVETAEENDVLICRVQPGEISEQGSYRDAPVVVDARAGFKDIYSFITAVRQMPRLVTIEEMSMGADEDGLAQVSFILRIYADTVSPYTRCSIHRAADFNSQTSAFFEKASEASSCRGRVNRRCRDELFRGEHTVAD